MCYGDIDIYIYIYIYIYKREREREREREKEVLRNVLWRYRDLFVQTQTRKAQMEWNVQNQQEYCIEQLCMYKVIHTR